MIIPRSLGEVMEMKQSSTMFNATALGSEHS